MSLVTRRLAIFSLGALALSGRALLAQGTALAALDHGAPGFDAGPAIAAANLGGSVSFAVMDPENGALLAGQDAGLSRAPASTLKTITALYALDRLGAGHQFRTRVLRAGDALILAGGGDPVLDSDALAELAKNTVAAEKAAGRTPPAQFLVWGGALPRLPEITSGQDVHLSYNPAVSGLNLNFNRVYLDWRRGENGYRIVIEARARRHSPRAYTVRVGAADRGSPLFTYLAEPARENWTMARRAMGKSGSRWLPVRMPELYAGDVFQTLCRAQGLALPTPAVISDMPEAHEIASHSSPPLTEIIRDMLDYSTNLTAEVIGLAASGAGSIPASARMMQDWLAGFGLSGQAEFHDHSGLSAANRVDALLLASVMAGPGQRQGLEALLKDIALRNAQGKEIPSDIKVRAKTGTLNFVSNLAGYMRTPDGRNLAFAVLTGDETRRASSEGQELPEGVLGWTKRSKALQQALIEGWSAAYGPTQTAPEGGLSQGAVAGAG